MYVDDFLLFGDQYCVTSQASKLSKKDRRKQRAEAVKMGERSPKATPQASPKAKIASPPKAGVEKGPKLVTCRIVAHVAEKFMCFPSLEKDFNRLKLETVSDLIAVFVTDTCWISEDDPRDGGGCGAP